MYAELSNGDKEEMQNIIGIFEHIYNMESKRLEKKGKEYRDRKKAYFQRKSTIDCAREYIENEEDAYICGTGLLKLGSVIQKIYAQNPERFLKEVINNYSIIGTQVWGFSQDLVFSNETEERFLATREPARILSAEEIGTDLSKISNAGVTLAAELALINMADRTIENGDNEQKK